MRFKQALTKWLEILIDSTPLETVGYARDSFRRLKRCEVLLPFDWNKNNFTKVSTQDCVHSLYMALLVSNKSTSLAI